MTELLNLRENFTLVGNARISKDPLKYVVTAPSGKNGWTKETINLGIQISDTNRIYVNQEAGYWSDEAIERTKNAVGKGSNGKDNKKQNWIYNGAMEDVETNGITTKKWVADNIAFADRFKPEAIEKVQYFNRIRVALEPEMVGVNDEEGNIQTVPKKDDKGNIVYIEKDFIFVGDAIDYIKAHLSYDQRVYVSGSSEINQYINTKSNKLVTQVNRRINQIRVAKDDEENEATGITNFYFEKDGFDKSEFAKTKKYIIDGYRTYKNDDKKVVPVPTEYILDFSSPNVDWEDETIKARVDYLVEVFETAKKDMIYSTSWRYMLFEGNEEQELTEKDLSKDLQKRVKLGFISLEEAIKQMRGGAIGDRIKVVKLVMPLGEENKVETDYTSDDLIAPVIENKVNKVQEKAKAEKEEKKEADTNNITKKFDSMFK